MKNWKFLKISSGMITLIIMLSLYNHCTGQFGNESKGLKFKNSTTSSPSNAPLPSPSALPEDSRTVSLNAFSTSVYTITRARCLNCHATIIRPFHASAEMALAHDEIINNAKINLNDVAQSRLVLKLQEGHNCWSNCTNNSNEMRDAASEWKAALDEWQAEQDAQDNSNSSNTPANLTTSEVGPLNILANAQGNSSGTTMVRPEQFSVFSPMVFFQQGTDAYFWVPNGNSTAARAANDVAGGRASTTVSIASAGTYRFYALVDAPNGSDNSIYFTPKAGTTATWRIETLTSGFEWREITNGLDELDFSTMLPQGNNTIEFKQREDGTKIAGLIVSNDPNLDLNDITFGTKVKLTFNLQTITGRAATITMVIEEFDEYTYKISDVRLLSPVAMEVKQIRFLVNGVYNPQHSTYSYINSTFQAGDVSLSPSSMLVLKDQGDNADRFSLSFEILRAVP